MIVDRLPPGSAATHAPSLMQFLPAVWAGGSNSNSNSSSPSSSSTSGSSSMLKVQCVSLLSRLLLSLGDESPAAYPALLPMLSECLSEPRGRVSASAPSAPPGAAIEADLAEDGLGLWLVALRSAPTAWGRPRARPLVAAGCAAAAQSLARTSATALAPLAAAGAGSAALLSCCSLLDESSSSSPSSSSAAAASAAAAAAAVEFATMPEVKLLCDRLSLAAGEASERATMALVASVDLILASVTSASSPSPEASQAALSLLQNSLVRLTASIFRGKEGPAVAGGVAALVARVVLAGEEGGSGSGGAALAALASAAAAAAAASASAAAATALLPLPNPPSLALIDLMLERAPSLPSGARKGSRSPWPRSSRPRRRCRRRRCSSPSPRPTRPRLRGCRGRARARGMAAMAPPPPPPPLRACSSLASQACSPPPSKNSRGVGAAPRGMEQLAITVTTAKTKTERNSSLCGSSSTPRWQRPRPSAPPEGTAARSLSPSTPKARPSAGLRCGGRERSR